jgi:hypothetical protein
MTDAEIAQIVADEWERPMIRANKADADAFDYFASCEQAPISLSTHLVGALVCSALVMFIGSLAILVSIGSTGWALAFCEAACVMLLIATILGVTRK